MEMRKVLATELEKLMNENEKIVIINADLAKAAGLSGLYSKFPNRCFNVGIAEQNMASIAAGLSSYGYIPLIFTFTPFASRRICDQIAVSICYARQNVKIFGLDPGIVATNNGGTHMSFEDVGIIRSMPKTIIFEPCDEIQLRSSLNDIVSYNGMVYVRMFRKETPVVLNDDYKFTMFRNDILKEGSDVSIFCSGIMVEESLKSWKILKDKGISAEIINVHTVKPLDSESILSSLRKTKKCVVAENHNRYGGLFSAICELSAECFPVPVKCVAVNDEFGQVGNLQYLKNYYGLTSDHIVNDVLDLINASEKK